MFTLFIIIILTMGLVASVGYSVFTFQRSSEMVSLVQRNAAKMETIGALMKGSSLLDGVGLRIPAGQIDGGRMRLPQWVVGDDRAPWGGRYAFCPYATSGSPGGTIQVPTGRGNYKIEEATIAGRPYVIKSDLPPSASLSNQGLIGLIVSPAPYSDVAPHCEDVVLSDGRWIVNAAEGAPVGSVIPVTAGGPASAVASFASEPALYVAPGADASGSGREAGSPTSLAYASAYWSQTKPRSMTIHMTPGSYQVAEGDLDFLSGGPGRLIRLEGSGTVEVTSASPVTAQLATDAEIKGIALAESVTLTVIGGARVELTKGTSVRSASVQGGDLIVGQDATLIYTGAAPVVELTSGRLKFVGPGAAISAPAGTTGAAISAVGGEISVEGNLSVSPGIQPWDISGTARLDGNAGTMRINGQPIPTDVKIEGEECSDLEGVGVCKETSVVCPAMTYAVSGYCDAAALNEEIPMNSPLVESRAVGGNGWQCRWAPDQAGVYPAFSQAVVNCSATRPNVQN